jgi:hypothetical protein
MRSDDDPATRQDTVLEGPLIGYTALVVALILMLIA